MDHVVPSQTVPSVINSNTCLALLLVTTALWQRNAVLKTLHIRESHSSPCC
jgi:hypothetical protein